MRPVPGLSGLPACRHRSGSVRGDRPARLRPDGVVNHACSGLAYTSDAIDWATAERDHA
jgi:hypothetical protein